MILLSSNLIVALLVVFVAVATIQATELNRMLSDAQEIEFEVGKLHLSQEILSQKQLVHSAGEYEFEYSVSNYLAARE